MPGSLDAGFEPGSTVDGSTGVIVLQPDGQVLVGGTFSRVPGGLARLNPDGTLDPTFHVAANAVTNGVNALALQPDGRILVADSPTYYSEQTRSRILRLNSDGSLDPTFAICAVTGSVNSVTGDDQGRILVGGQFTAIAGQPQQALARLSPVGGFDASFTPTFRNSDPMSSLWVKRVAVTTPLRRAISFLHPWM